MSARQLRLTDGMGTFGGHVLPLLVPIINKPQLTIQFKSRKRFKAAVKAMKSAMR